jgi:hypothetical protein
LAETCTKLGISFLDLTPTVRAQEEAGTHMYWEYDIHMRPVGYMTAGRAIYDWWNAEKRYPRSRQNSGDHRGRVEAATGRF